MKTTTLIASSMVLAAAGLVGCDNRNGSKTDGRTTTKESVPTTRETAPKAPPAPDNTANNRKDSRTDAKTPTDQSESSASIRITADIRRAIMEDSGMSVNAQNCKIITDEAGVVTLRGVVNSQQEKDAIDAKAKAVVGVTRVDNQLEVKTP